MDMKVKALRSILVLSGVLYFIVILLALLKMAIIDSAIIGASVSITIENIRSNISLFKLGILLDIIMYVLVLCLSVSLFYLLKDTNKVIASLAFSLRFAESILGFVVIIIGGIIPTVLIGDELTSISSTEINIFNTLSVSSSACMMILLLIMGIGGVLYFLLMIQTNYLPKIISIWGIITYLIMIIFPIITLFIKNIPEYLSVAVYAPGSIFELLVGVLLTVKGIKAKEKHLTTAST